MTPSEDANFNDFANAPIRAQRRICSDDTPAIMRHDVFLDIMTLGQEIMLPASILQQFEG